MKNIVRIVTIFAIFTSLSACISKEQDDGLKLTGLEINDAWKAYNEFATTNDAPLLNYFAFGKNENVSKVKWQPEDITSKFTEEDERICAYTHWTNVFGKHIYLLRVYDPRGVLFEPIGCNFSRLGRGISWNVLACIYVDKAPASRLPGKWTCELYMDDKLAAREHFFIGDEKAYPPIEYSSNKAIGVVMFVRKHASAKRFTKRFTINLPQYISSSLTIDMSDCKVVHPHDSLKYFPIMEGCNIMERCNIEKNAAKILNSKLFDEYVKKYNLGAVILGSYYDEAKVNRYKRFTILVVDAKEKTIVKTIHEKWRSAHNYENMGNYPILSAYNKVYNTIIKEAKADIHKLIAQP